jgi:tRNA/rRNA methyltransferase
VLILGYEWMRTSGAATLGRVTTYETPQAPGLDLGDTRPATKAELEGFFEHLENELDQMGFFNPAHRRQAMVRNLRTMFTRMGATEQEVRTLRGIVVALAHGKGRGRKRP